MLVAAGTKSKAKVLPSRMSKSKGANRNVKRKENKTNILDLICAKYCRKTEGKKWLQQSESMDRKHYLIWVLNNDYGKTIQATLE